MKCLTLNAIKSPLVLEERAALEPGPGEVVVELEAAALNRRDYWITQGMYPGIEPPVVLGSDGAGTVREAGCDVGQPWVSFFGVASGGPFALSTNTSRAVDVTLTADMLPCDNPDVQAMVENSFGYPGPPRETWLGTEGVIDVERVGTNWRVQASATIEFLQEVRYVLPTAERDWDPRERDTDPREPVQIEVDREFTPCDVELDLERDWGRLLSWATGYGY